MHDAKQPPASTPLLTVLQQAGVRTLAEVAARPTRDPMADLDRLTIPPSEALLGTLVLSAVGELHEAPLTHSRGHSPSRLLSLMRWSAAETR